MALPRAYAVNPIPIAVTVFHDAPENPKECHFGRGDRLVLFDDGRTALRVDRPGKWRMAAHYGKTHADLIFSMCIWVDHYHARVAVVEAPTEEDMEASWFL